MFKSLDAPFSISTSSFDETVGLGKAFGENLSENSVVFLKGEMGSGKTHFTKGIAKAFGITTTVTSPTFAIVNEYPPLYHFDLFRLKSIDDLYSIGFFDYINNGILIIEWPENIPDIESEFEEYYTVCINKIENAKNKENERVIHFDYTRN